jgi:uncharacterized delta-60 repeat protein
VTTRTSSLLHALGAAALLSCPHAARAQPARSIHLMRVNPTGTMDTSFAADGHLIDNVSSSSSDIVEAITTSSPGQIVIAGCSTTSTPVFMVGVLEPDGTPDMLFSSDGYATTNWLEWDEECATSVVAAAGGKVLAAVTPRRGLAISAGCWRAGSRMARPTTASMNTTNMSSFSETIEDVYIGSSARIAVVGSAMVSTTERRAAIARFNDDGMPHTGFSGDGKLLIDDPEGSWENRARSARIGPSDTIYTGGWVAND